MGYGPVDLEPYNGEVATQQVEGDCPGPWLRAWIEFHVDARVNQALRDLMEGTLTKVEDRGRNLPVVSSPVIDSVPQRGLFLLTDRLEKQWEVARLEAETVQEEVRGVAQNQAKLPKLQQPHAWISRSVSRAYALNSPTQQGPGMTSNVGWT